jgi:ribosomal protein S18 acetylase RimI-like enzyme
MDNVVRLPHLRVCGHTPDRGERAAEFLHRNWHETYRRFLPADLRAERSVDYFRHYLADRRNACWLALYGNRLVGLATVSANCVDDLWVGQGYRRRGIGRRLLKAAVAALRENGYESVQAGCEGFNRDALAFFDATGFRQIGVETVTLKPALRVEAIVLGRHLPPGAVA